MSFTIRNQITGEVLKVPDDPDSRSLYRFRLVCRALDRLKALLGWEIYFLTLTLSPDNLDTVNNDLGKFLDWLSKRFKRAGAKFYYVWVVELQLKRYFRRGEKALHWHFAILCPVGSLPHMKAKKRCRPVVVRDGDIVKAADIEASWGRGIIFSMLAYSNGVYGYLSKYFTKEYHKLTGYKTEWSKLRRFGSSQLKFFRYPKWAYEFVSSKISESPDLAEQFYIRKVGPEAGFYVKDGKRLHPVVVKRSPWSTSFDWSPDVFKESS